MTPTLRQHDDARRCADIVRAHARTFHAASRLLPEEKRRAVYALYACCRIADDIVDGSTPNTARRLSEYRRQVEHALTEVPTDPVMRELRWAVDRFAVPPHAIHELLDGVAMDLAHDGFATWSTLSHYCEGVASSVGEMCAHVFGVEDGDDATLRRAVRYARRLGAAMQLTNILRDVGEDARRGRCYLPADDLATFGLTAHDVLHCADVAQHEGWRPLMAFEVGRARALYELARPGLALLASDAARCATACAHGYAGILDAIVANGYDTITTRARLGRVARLGVLWRARIA